MVVGMLNETILRRLGKVRINTCDKELDVNVAIGLAGTLNQYGVALDLPLIEKLRFAEESDIKDIILAFDRFYGVVDKPFYPNFTEVVGKKIDTFGLMLNATIHYTFAYGFGKDIRPEQPDISFDGVVTSDAPRVLVGEVSDDELKGLFVSIASQPRPFSPQDVEDLENLKQFGEQVRVDTDVRENLVILTNMFPNLEYWEDLTLYTDVLRLASVYSGGDVSLSKPVKFRLSRPERKFLMAVLENIVTNYHREVLRTSDFATRIEQWQKLAHCLHPGDYAKDFPNAARILRLLRDKSKVKSIYSTLEETKNKEGLDAYLLKLLPYPGIFARRLAWMHREFPEDTQKINNAFAGSASRVSLPVLVSLWNYLNSADKTKAPQKTVTIKNGKNALTRNLKTNNDNTKELIGIIEKAIATYPSDKKIHPDSVDSDITVPVYTRSITPGIKALARGSKLKTANKDTGYLQYFTHWFNGENQNQVDIDLSLLSLTSDLKIAYQEISYYNLYNDYAIHSGDIVTAPRPDGAVEYINVDIEKALESGITYVAPVLISYNRNGINTADSPICGVMNKNSRNDKFEAGKVENALDLSGIEAAIYLPFITNLENMETTVTDMWLPHKPISGHHNVNDNKGTLATTINQILNSKFMDVKKLAELRGMVSEEGEKIDMGKIENAVSLLAT